MRKTTAQSAWPGKGGRGSTDLAAGREGHEEDNCTISLAWERGGGLRTWQQVVRGHEEASVGIQLGVLAGLWQLKARPCSSLWCATCRQSCLVVLGYYLFAWIDVFLAIASMQTCKNNSKLSHSLQKPAYLTRCNCLLSPVARFQ